LKTFRDWRAVEVCVLASLDKQSSQAVAPEKCGVACGCVGLSSSFRRRILQAVATPASAQLFQAATKLREARRNLAEAEKALQGPGEQSEVEQLREELSDLNWRTQSLAMRRERVEKPKGPWTPATDFPDYDEKSLKDAKDRLAEETTDLDLQAASLPPKPTKSTGDDRGPVRRAVERVKAALFSRLKGSADG
jgi:hypothetical protein